MKTATQTHTEREHAAEHCQAYEDPAEPTTQTKITHLEALAYAAELDAQVADQRAENKDRADGHENDADEARTLAENAKKADDDDEAEHQTERAREHNQLADEHRQKAKELQTSAATIRRHKTNPTTPPTLTEPRKKITETAARYDDALAQNAESRHWHEIAKHDAETTANRARHAETQLDQTKTQAKQAAERAAEATTEIKSDTRRANKERKDYIDQYTLAAIEYHKAQHLAEHAQRAADQAADQVETSQHHLNQIELELDQAAARIAADEYDPTRAGLMTDTPEA